MNRQRSYWWSSRGWRGSSASLGPTPRDARCATRVGRGAALQGRACQTNCAASGRLPSRDAVFGGRGPWKRSGTALVQRISGRATVRLIRMMPFAALLIVLSFYGGAAQRPALAHFALSAAPPSIAGGGA